VTDSGGFYAGNVAVFENARGTPRIYKDQDIRPQFCGYDASGNLYVDGSTIGSASEFTELRKNSHAFTNIAVDVNLRLEEAVQWDGRYITVAKMPSRSGKARIYRLQISGSSGTVVGTTKLLSPTMHFDGQSWIQGNTVVQIYGRHYSRLGVWPYPRGRLPTNTQDVGAYLYGVTVSLARH
jgi:hypothetical protein